MPSITSPSLYLSLAGIVLSVIGYSKIRRSDLLNLVKSAWFPTISGLLVGTLLAASLGQRYLYWQQLDGEIQQDVTIEGRIVEISCKSDVIRLIINQVSVNNRTWPADIAVLLYYYNPIKQFRSDQLIKAQIRLKPARAMANPAGFDTQKWYVSKQIAKTGYVVADNITLVVPSGSFRSTLQGKLLGVNPPGVKWLNAILFGDRSGLLEADWMLLKSTGTAHLFAISGLHLGLAGGVIALLVQIVTLIVRLMRMSQRASLMPLQWLCILLGSTAYAYCAHWQISVTRAYIALCLWMVCWLGARRVERSVLFVIAFALCIALQPHSVYGISLYLSFAAVALILGIHWRWRQLFLTKTAFWKRALIMQTLLCVGLIPVTLLAFGSASGLGLLFNLLFIPVMGLIAVPLAVCCLFLLALLPQHHSALTWSVNIAGRLFDYMIDVMRYMDAVLNTVIDSSLIKMAPAHVSVMLGILIGCTWLPSTKRYCAVMLIVSCLVLSDCYNNLSRRQWQIHYFDVGQGSAAIVTRNGKATVIDTGASFSNQGSYAQQVLVPFIQQSRLTLDTIVISHYDNDHAGGLSVLTERYPDANVVSPEHGCIAGYQWQWQGLDFHVLWPLNLTDNTWSENNRSCVIKIDNGAVSALFPGDIEAEAERAIVKAYSHDTDTLLHADMLLVPHHGSRTSSTPDFIDAVSPRVAIFSQGWLNRWGFPAVSVAARYDQRDIKTVLTGDSGYIQVTMTKALELTTYRQAGPWYHKAFSN